MFKIIGLDKIYHVIDENTYYKIKIVYISPISETPSKVVVIKNEKVIFSEENINYYEEGELLNYAIKKGIKNEKIN